MSHLIIRARGLDLYCTSSAFILHLYSLGPNLRPRWRLALQPSPAQKKPCSPAHFLLLLCVMRSRRQTSFDSSGPPSAISKVSTLTRRCEIHSFYFSFLFHLKLESSRPTRPCVAPAEILRFDRHQSRPRTRVRSKTERHPHRNRYGT